MIKLTNNPWIIRPALIPERLGADTYVIVNDFGAIAHAVAQLPDEHFLHICGPERPLAREGVTSICGPGTGLGVAGVLHVGDSYHVLSDRGGPCRFRTAGRVRGLDARAVAQNLHARFGGARVRRAGDRRDLRNAR